MPTHNSGSSSRRSIACSMPRATSPLTALRASGRLRVITATWSSASNVTMSDIVSTTRSIPGRRPQSDREQLQALRCRLASVPRRVRCRPLAVLRWRRVGVRCRPLAVRRRVLRCRPLAVRRRARCRPLAVLRWVRRVGRWRCLSRLAAGCWRHLHGFGVGSRWRLDSLGRLVRCGRRLTGRLLLARGGPQRLRRRCLVRHLDVEQGGDLRKQGPEPGHRGDQLGTRLRWRGGWA